MDWGIMSVEGAQAPEQRGIVIRRDLALPRDPAEQVAVRHLDETLELVEVGIPQGADLGIGEAAHDQVHLTRAAVPGPKQRPAPAMVEVGARARRAGHVEIP